MDHPIGEVAAFAGVTVRALHHYEEIGLLRPSRRTPAGHRRYTDGDLARLQQIRFYQELGFRLDEVAALLDDPETDPTEHLRRQHALLLGRAARLEAMAAAVERTLEAHRMGVNLTPEERFEVFGERDPEQYATEADRRWGDGPAYREARRRTARYTKDDWRRITGEQRRVGARFAELLRSGAAATCREAMDLAEEHRRQVCRYFYDCDHTVHRGLADLYESDPRFTEGYGPAPELGRYVGAAIRANADRHEG